GSGRVGGGGRARRHGLPALADVAAVGRGLEPRPWYRRTATQAAGLTQAFWQALDAREAEGEGAAFTYGDLNGEPWRADEWAFAYLRTGKRHGEPLDLRHPADCWGDVGAASGPLLVGLAVRELRRGRPGKDTALVWTASDIRPNRAACLLRPHRENPPSPPPRSSPP